MLLKVLNPDYRFGLDDYDPLSLVVLNKSTKSWMLKPEDLPDSVQDNLQDYNDMIIILNDTINQKTPL